MTCAGLNSFTALPIGPPATPAGALLLGRAAPAPPRGGAQLRLHAAPISLLQHAHAAAAVQVAQLLRVMDDTQDPVALISVLLRVHGAARSTRIVARRARNQPRAAPAWCWRPPTTHAPAPWRPGPQSAQRYMSKASSMRMSARLALLQWHGCQEALMFELPPAGGGGGGGGGGSVGGSVGSVGGGDAPPQPRGQLVLPGDALAYVNASTMVRARAPARRTCRARPRTRGAPCLCERSEGS